MLQLKSALIQLKDVKDDEMSSNYNVLKELLKNCLLSAFNLAGGTGNKIEGVETVSQVRVEVSYVFFRKLPYLFWCHRPCPSTAQQCIFDLNDTINLSEIRGASTHHMNFDCIWG